MVVLIFCNMLTVKVDVRVETVVMVFCTMISLTHDFVSRKGCGNDIP